MLCLCLSRNPQCQRLLSSGSIPCHVSPDRWCRYHPHHPSHSTHSKYAANYLSALHLQDCSKFPPLSHIWEIENCNLLTAGRPAISSSPRHLLVKLCKYIKYSFPLSRSCFQSSSSLARKDTRRLFSLPACHASHQVKQGERSTISSSPTPKRFCRRVIAKYHHYSPPPTKDASTTSTTK